MEQFRSDRQREGACSSAGKGVAGLYRSFGRARLGLAAVWEEEILREVSRDIASTDFSSQVLTQFSGEFAVLPVTGVRWSVMSGMAPNLEKGSSLMRRRT
jgi:hypothetical protein